MLRPYRIVAIAGLVLMTGLFTTLGYAQNTTGQILRDDPEIHEGLTVIAVGRHIHAMCDDIRPRIIHALGFAEGLVERAQDLGVSRRDVNAFIDDRDEQARYRNVMRDWFIARGVDAANQSAVCQVGRDEIFAGTQIGRLLRRR